MSTHNKTLRLIATKLGLSNEVNVLGKAAEFLRLLQTKSIAGTNVTDTSKIVICLDLAATMLGADLDIKIAIKYSGLKPTVYTNSKKIIANLLDLNSDKLTTNMLCVTLQCSGVQELADRMLDEYRRMAKMEVDFNLPQYVCMAVYQACRMNKVKISKSKVVEKSRLKPSQWAKLDVDWTKFVDEHFVTAKKKRERPLKTHAPDVENIEAMDIDINKKEEPSEPQIEAYDDWKKRMLESAYKDLRELEKAESNMDAIKSMTPRRSPRKTPQKFSPYKSPSTCSGVRLLFPINL